MQKNEIGLTVLEKGDEVLVGKGRVRYTVFFQGDNDLTTIQSQNTGKFTTVETGRLTLVSNVRDTEEWKAANEEAPAREMTEMDKHLRFVAEHTTSTAKDDKDLPDVSKHVPGESPAQYKARTGKKLDGRTTIYGRMILVGLQAKKHIFAGGRRNPSPRRRADARRVGIKSASDPE